MFIANIESKKIYKVVRQAQEEGKIYLERVGDGYAVRIGPVTLQNQYAVLSPEATAKLIANIAAIDRRGVPFTLEQLERMMEEPDPHMPQGEGEQAAEDDIKIGTLVTPDDRHDFGRIVIHEDVMKSIDIGLHKISKKDFLNDQWNLKTVEPMGGRVAFNFYGPPGTGKTLSACAVAKKLGKKLLQVDYSQIISKWVGDTGKHLAEAFALAKKNDAVLFFDEADAMLSKRVSDESAASQPGINQNRNILMQELDKFDGIVIFTTNLFGNYDEALLRRIAQHVEFVLPDETMRAKLIEQHIPAAVPREDAFNILELARVTKDFSGGDIKNVCVNGIIAASMADPQVLTMAHMQSEIKKVSEAKKNHAGKKGSRKPLGFAAMIE